MKPSMPNFAIAMIVDDAVIYGQRQGRRAAAEFMLKYRVPFSVLVRVLEPGGQRRARRRHPAELPV